MIRDALFALCCAAAVTIVALLVDLLTTERDLRPK